MGLKLKSGLLDSVGLVGLILSVLGGSTLHLYALQIYLLGSLSPLADGVFWSDLVTNFIVNVAVAGLASRLIYFGGFYVYRTIFWEIFVFLILIAIKRDHTRAKFELRRFSRRIGIFYFRNTFGFSTLFFFIFFWGSYFGSPGFFRLLFIFIGLTLLHFSIWIAYLMGRKSVQQGMIKARTPADYRKIIVDELPTVPFTVKASAIVIPILVFCWWAGGERARKIGDENIVRVELSANPTDIYCYSLLGKSETGLFFKSVISANDAPEFIPLSQIQSIMPITTGKYGSTLGVESFNCEDYKINDYNY